MVIFQAIVSIHGCKFLNFCPEKMLPPRFEMVALKGNFDESDCASFFSDTYTW